MNETIRIFIISTSRKVSIVCLCALIKFTKHLFMFDLLSFSHRAPGGSTTSSRTRLTTWVTVWRVTKRIIWSSTLHPFNLLWPSCLKTPTLITTTRPPYSPTPHPQAQSPHTPSQKSSMYEYTNTLSPSFLSWWLCTLFLLYFLHDVYLKHFNTLFLMWNWTFDFINGFIFS